MSTTKLNAALAQAGAAGLGRARLQQVTGLPERTLTRELHRLAELGVVERIAHGVFRRADVGDRPPALPTKGAGEVWAALHEGSLPAYLSGLDLLAGYVEHFVFQTPHLVVTDRGAADQVAFVLQEREFIVLDPKGGGVRTPDDDRLVVLREYATWRRYGVHGHLAPTELAWVDLYREVRRGRFTFGPLELGRVLRNLIRAGGEARRLRTYARGHFGGEINNILSGRSDVDEFVAAVARGLHGA